MCHVSGDFVPSQRKKEQRTASSVIQKQVSDDLPMGLPALFEELAKQGVSAETICAEAGVPRSSRNVALRTILSDDLPAIFQASARLAKHPETALRAGQRQKISNFGVFGFALVTSKTFADAFRFGLENLDLAGAVMHITYRREGNLGILQTHNPQALGTNLQFVAEFWRSSMSSLLAEVLAHPFPSVAMYFPYRAPRHLAAYKRAFDCDLHFGAHTMQWHFDAEVLDEDCPNADSLTAQVCQEFCERVVSSRGQSKLQRTVRSLCMTKTSGATVTAESVAASMGMSVRTFHRRLADEGVTFKALFDETRFSIASEYLRNTQLGIEEIASRCGYGDVSNFRKAFKRWNNLSPSAYRAQEPTLSNLSVSPSYLDAGKMLDA